MGDAGAILVAYVRNGAMHSHTHGAVEVRIGPRELHVVISGILVMLPDEGCDFPLLNATGVDVESLSEELWWWSFTVMLEINNGGKLQW